MPRPQLPMFSPYCVEYLSFNILTTILYYWKSVITKNWMKINSEPLCGDLTNTIQRQNLNYNQSESSDNFCTTSIVIQNLYFPSKILFYYEYLNLIHFQYKIFFFRYNLLLLLGSGLVEMWWEGKRKKDLL